MTRIWWTRNRLWLVALLPALALALVSSAFRLTTLYLPWQWSKPTEAHGPSGTLHQRFLGFDDKYYERTVDVTVTSAKPVDSFDGAAAVPGGTLWQVDFEFTARPDQLLTGSCHVDLLDADGVRYNSLPGKQAADPDSFYLAPIVPPQCVPEEAPGPEVAPITGELVPSPVERPRTWQWSTSVAMPDGVTPERVRIGWLQPVYLELLLAWPAGSEPPR